MTEAPLWLLTGAAAALSMRRLYAHLMGWRRREPTRSNRRTGQTELEDSESRLRLAMEVGGLGAWDYDMERNEVVLEESLRVAYGFPPGMNVVSLDAIRAGIEDWDRVAAGGNSEGALKGAITVDEFRYRRPDGSQRWFLYASRQLLNADGKPVRALGIAMDITSRKLVESSLRESLTRFEQVANNIDDAIVLIDVRERRTVYVNPAAETLSGRPVSLLYDDYRQFFGMVHPDDLAELKSTLRRSDSVEAEFRVVRPNGAIRTVLLRVYPVRGPDGDALRWVGIARDMTAQRAAERLVRDQHAKIMASAKLSALGEMAAGIAHEINNPLAVIEARSRHLQTYLRPETMNLDGAVKAAASIQGMAARIDRIIRGLRSLTRNADNDPFSTVRVDALIEGVVALCAERLRHKGVSLMVRPVAPADLTIDCREAQIAQVLFNLVQNALDAVEALPERWIEIAAGARGGQVDITVTDSGAGIPAAIREKMFQPFFTSKEPGKGTGLGLSIARGIVGQHRGTLTVAEGSPHTRMIMRVPQAQPAGAAGLC